MIIWLKGCKLLSALLIIILTLTSRTIKHHDLNMFIIIISSSSINILTFQFKTRNFTSAKNCKTTLSLLMCSIPTLPFLIKGFVDPHKIATRMSQNELPTKKVKHIYRCAFKNSLTGLNYI